MKWSIPLLLISELVMYLWQPSAGTAECIMLLQLIPVLAVIPVTEKALAKTFDRQGNSAGRSVNHNRDAEIFGKGGYKKWLPPTSHCPNNVGKRE